jgi:predicted GIY-YIG superfamily endonuclease
MLQFVYHIENEIDNTVVYVGITNHPNGRVREHFARSPQLKALHDAGVPLVMKVDEILDDRSQAYARETHWIHHYKSLGMPLVNKIKLPKTPNPKKTTRYRGFAGSVNKIWKDVMLEGDLMDQDVELDILNWTASLLVESDKEDESLQEWYRQQQERFV